MSRSVSADLAGDRRVRRSVAVAVLVLAASGAAGAYGASPIRTVSTAATGTAAIETATGTGATGTAAAGTATTGAWAARALVVRTRAASAAAARASAARSQVLGRHAARSGRAGTPSVGSAARGSVTAGSVATGSAAGRSWAAGSAATGATAPRSVGVMFHGLWTSYTDEQRATVLDQFQAAGVKSVRIDVSWVMLQPHDARSYDSWGVGMVDRVVAMANARNIRPLMMLWLTPAWANGTSDQRMAPDRPEDYARVAGWAAQRWRGKVVGWEVWNEPNSPAFLRGADPVAYTRILRAAYPAIKAGDPAAAVVSGGVEYNDVEWLRRAYDAGAKGSFDVLATHPYQGIADLPPDARDGTKWTLTDVSEVRRLMVERGDAATPIWFTEFGWSTHDVAAGVNWIRGVNEQRQAAYLSATARLVAAEMPYVQRIYWYSDRDSGEGDPQYANYGLFRRDLSPKPALAALAAVNAAAG
jgi:polysaccharide biosynthesis protein PslG